MGYVQRLKDDLEAIERLHEGCSARIASGGGRMRVTMDRYEVCTWEASRFRVFLNPKT